MTLRSEYASGHSEYNDFLFALIGEEKSGAQLTVLSALTRLGLDPWGEAARMSGLTKNAATSAMAAKIAILPEGDWKASDSRSITVRLVDLLPRHVAAPADTPRGRDIMVPRPMSDAQKWLLWIGFAPVLFLALTRLIGD